MKPSLHSFCAQYSKSWAYFIFLQYTLIQMLNFDSYSKMQS